MNIYDSFDDFHSYDEAIHYEEHDTYDELQYYEEYDT